MNKTSIKNRESRLGEVYETNNCGKCFIVDYKSSKKDLTIQQLEDTIEDLEKESN